MASIDSLTEIHGWFQNLGIPSQLIPQSEEISIDQLFVTIPPDDQERGRFMAMGFLPGGKPEEQPVKYLQLFAQMPFEVPADHAGEVKSLLLHLNGTMPMVGFGYVEERGMVYLRSVLLLHEPAITKQVVVEAYGLVLYLLNTYGSIIEEVAEGKKSYKEVVG